MPFIRVHNLKKDEQGRIVRGSAGLIDAVYVKVENPTNFDRAYVSSIASKTSISHP